MTSPETEQECPKCAELADACPDCSRKIHESWHKAGMWWIRPWECHENCPGSPASMKDRKRIPDCIRAMLVLFKEQENMTFCGGVEK